MNLKQDPAPDTNAISFAEYFREFLTRHQSGTIPDAETARLIDVFGACLGWAEVEYQAEVKDPAPPHFNNEEERALAVHSAFEQAALSLKELRVLAAAGDKAAIAALVELLLENATWLEGYSSRDNGNLKATARRAGAWPVVWANRSRRAKDVASYLKRIELSAKAQISPSRNWGNSWEDKGSVATFYAMEIRNKIGQAKEWVCSFGDIFQTNGPLSGVAWEKVPQWAKDAVKLPPLTKKSAPKWFKIGWQLILEKHNGHPEKDSNLKTLAEATRKDKYARSYDKKVSPQRTAAADVRSRIKERVLQALVSLAPSQ